jgi:outer membrane lipoprotein-sorting protein
MRKTWIWLPDFYSWPILFLFILGCAAAGPATQPQALSQKSTVDEILDALDARGKDLQDFSAKVVLTAMDNSSGEMRINTGTTIFQRKGADDARIRVTFIQQQVDDKILSADHQYILDNGILDDRDYKKKRENILHVLKPGEKLDLFKLGQGPFPLPLGQKKEDVHALFQVDKIDPDPADPPKTVHLRLTPKEKTTFAKTYHTIDIWVDTATGMPSRIQTVDLSQSTTKTADLLDVKLNTGIGDKDFVQPPMPPDSDIAEGPSPQ